MNLYVIQLMKDIELIIVQGTENQGEYWFNDNRIYIYMHVPFSLYLTDGRKWSRIKYDTLRMLTLSVKIDIRYARLYHDLYLKKKKSRMECNIFIYLKIQLLFLVSEFIQTTDYGWFVVLYIYSTVKNCHLFRFYSF